MISQADPSQEESLRPAVAVLGDDLTVRRIRATLADAYRVVAHGQTVDALLDAEAYRQLIAD